MVFISWQNLIRLGNCEIVDCLGFSRYVKTTIVGLNIELYIFTYIQIINLAWIAQVLVVFLKMQPHFQWLKPELNKQVDHVSLALHF